MQRYIEIRPKENGEKQDLTALADKIVKNTGVQSVDKVFWNNDENTGSFRLTSYRGGVDFTEAYQIICDAGYAIIKDKTE